MKYQRVRFDGDAIVVVLDICSSSDVIEELTLNGGLEHYKQLLTSLKQYLAAAQDKLLFDPYKFTGDGWILLFPSNTDGNLLFTFLQNLCRFFKKEFQKEIVRHLASPPRITGLTFGIEMGPLAHMTMYGQSEYIGRALNVATRLQASIADKDKSPNYKAIVSNRAFNEYFSTIRGVKILKVKRTLKNIRDGLDFHCRKIQLLNSKM
jgi:hypothetical protein